jgi:hypothetical protein
VIECLKCSSPCIVDISLILLGRFSNVDSQIFQNFEKYDRLTFRLASIFSKANEHLSSLRVILPLYHDSAEFHAFFLVNQHQSKLKQLYILDYM